MEEWLRARNWVSVDEEHWDNPTEREYFMSTKNDRINFLYILSLLFDTRSRLKPMLPNDWKDEYLRHTVTKIPTSSNKSDDDDIPF